MPENEEKPQDQQHVATEKPGEGRKGVGAVKKSDREARLADALRANLRRRKAGGAKASGDEASVEEKDT